MLIPAFSARYVHNASDPLLLLHHLVIAPKIALHYQELSLHVRICFPIQSFSSVASPIVIIYSKPLQRRSAMPTRSVRVLSLPRGMYPPGFLITMRVYNPFL